MPLNPLPDASSLPESVLDLRVQLSNVQDALSKEEHSAIQAFQRIANYMAAAMIYLRKNALLETPLSREDIKPRLLGHWGTCPGLTLIYSHLNLLLRKNNLDMFLVTGPGHGAPAILASLWLEDSFKPFYPELTRTKEGLEKLVTGFSTPSGFPSHVSADVPGSIHEGGELGYALAVSYGAAMDSPELIVACVVGDGEAETGPTATAWHAHKYIDPAESGAVLPILHCNGFKISEKTIFGTMDDKEIISLFTGYGYQTCIVSDLDAIDHELATAMQWALTEIRSIQKAARKGNPIVKPRWPLIVLKTPKGMSGPKYLHNEPIEGSFKSHQVPLSSPTTDDEQFQLLSTWLESYSPSNLFNWLDQIDQYIVPTEMQKRMGQRKETYDAYVPLKMPAWEPMGIPKEGMASETKLLGEFLRKVIEANPSTTRLWCPDELTSNKLSAVLSTTSRDFQPAPESRAKGGRVIEILSEHTCQGMMQGYTLTGRTGIFPSYESFLGIVHTMMVQFAKFTKMGRQLEWRKDIGSFNYLETSTWTRQEHNGFSHQNPSFIGAVLNLKANCSRVYLPPDANCMLSTMAHCLDARNYVNLVIGSKHETPVWLSVEEAAAHCKRGASAWEWASSYNGENPDVILVGIGVEITFEVLSAASLLLRIAPALRFRVINVTDLMVLGPPGTHPHALSDKAWEELFEKEKRVHFSFHGYAIELMGLLFGRKGLERVSIEGYREEGTTTTPLAMLVLNRVSRYDVARVAIEAARKCNPEVEDIADRALQEIEKSLDEFWNYIKGNGKDPDGMFEKPKF